MMRPPRIACCLAAMGILLAGCGGKPAPEAAPAPTPVPALAPVAEAPPDPATLPPPSFVMTTSDVRATRLLDVRDGLSKTAAFRAATDLLVAKYSVDVSDAKAGYLMTPWQAGSRQGAPDLRYRTRVIIRFIGESWKQVSVRADANWQHGEGWDIGLDERLLDEVASELTARVGRK